MRTTLVHLLAAFLFVPATVVAKPAAKSAPKVRLLSAGKGKRRLLRVRPKVGATQMVSMATRSTVSMKMGEMTMPPAKTPKMLFDTEVRVTEVRKNNDIRFEFKYTKARVADGASAPKPMVDAINKAIAELVGSGGYGVINEMGHALDGSVELGNKASPALRQLVGSIEEFASQLTSPFPAEAVGVGAKWEVTTRFSMKGVALEQVARYELVSMKGDALKLAISIEQSAPSQSIAPPGMPPGATAKLQRLAGTGKGTAKVSLRSVAPQDSTLSVTTEMDMKLSAEGQSQTMSMASETELSFSSK